MHLNPESLSFALLLSDLGSIARAANILGMKQATLSRNSRPLKVGSGFASSTDRLAEPCLPSLWEDSPLDPSKDSGPIYADHT
jgi:hypothetical protein